MVVEFKAVEAIDALVALLRVAEDAAVHSWEQDEAIHPGIFPGLILLARFASQRAGTEYRLAVEVAEQLAQVTAERNAAREQQLMPRHVDLPDIPRFTEQQMADFKAVMAQVSDSVGTDGEGQP